MYFITYEIARQLHEDRIAEVLRPHQTSRMSRAHVLGNSLRGAAVRLQRLAERLDPAPCP